MGIRETNIEDLITKIETGEPLEDLEKTAVAAMIRGYVRNLENAGRASKIAADKRRKFASDKDRSDFHNAQKKRKKQNP